MPSRRQERIAKRVTQELVDAFRNLKHVELGFVTITRCEISPDLRHARVFVSVWGGDEAIQGNMETLGRNAAKLRMMIARPLGIKATPELHFEYDESLVKADRINRLIRDARSTDANPDPLDPGEEAAPPAVAGDGGRDRDAVPADPFEAARFDVEEELFGDDDDPDWRPINLDELPDAEDDGDGDGNEADEDAGNGGASRDA